MEGDEGGDDSEFGSVTSSQVSIPNHSRFIGHSPDRRIPLENSTGDRTDSDTGIGSDHTEVLGDQFLSPVVRTPILTSQDSVFRTPPEEPFLSSVADSDPTIRVSVTDPASASVNAPGDSESQSSGADKVRVLVATPGPASSSSATESVRVSSTELALATGNSESPSLETETVSVLEATPDSSPSSTTVNVRVSEKEPDSASPSFGSENARVSGKTPASAPMSSSPGNVRVLGKRPGSASDAPTGKFRVLESAAAAAGDHDSGEARLPVSLKDIIEALLRNSGEAEPNAEYEDLSIVEILRKSGIRFPY